MSHMFVEHADCMMDVDMPLLSSFEKSLHPLSSSLHPEVPPPSFPLYNDVLLLINNFLDVKDLHCAVQLSKQWFQVVKTMRSLSLKTGFKRFELIPVNSLAARHIAEAEPLYQHLSEKPNFLHKVSSVLPSLKYLSVPHDCASTALALKSQGRGLRFPPMLQKLQVAVDFEDIPQVLEAIVHLPRLRVLEVEFVLPFSKTPRDIDFSPLGSFRPTLDTLRMTFRTMANWKENQSLNMMDPLSPSMVRFIRESSIQKLHVGNNYYFQVSKLVQQLAAEGLSCHLFESGALTEIDLTNVTLDLPLLQCLVDIPTLTRLSPSSVHLDAIDMHLLARFDNLAEISLRTALEEESITTQAIVEGCRNCPRLRSLELSHRKLSSAELDEILSCVPRLTKLELLHCEGLKSLAPLAKHQVPSRLQSLKILQDGPMSVSDVVEHIFPLQQLEQLHLTRGFSCCLPENIKENLTAQSPSCVLPKLVSSVLSP